MKTLGENYDRSLKQYADSVRETQAETMRRALVVYWTWRKDKESAQALATLGPPSNGAPRRRPAMSDAKD